MRNLKEFLDGLSELTQKYGLEIGGCGCCGSPWVEEIEGNERLDELTYDREAKKYRVCDFEEGVETGKGILAEVLKLEAERLLQPTIIDGNGKVKIVGIKELSISDEFSKEDKEEDE